MISSRGIFRRLRRIVGRLLFCARGRHKASRRQMKWGDGFWYGRSRYCRVPMQRLRKNVWITLREGGPLSHGGGDNC